MASTVSTISSIGARWLARCRLSLLVVYASFFLCLFDLFGAQIRWDNWLLAQYIGSRTAVAVDATQVVLAIHLNHMKVGGSHDRTGTDYNVQLTAQDRVDPKKIGDLESADFVLQAQYPDEPFCPNCGLKRTEQSLDVVLYKHASNTSDIIIATVNSGYVSLLLYYRLAFNCRADIWTLR